MTPFRWETDPDERARRRASHDLEGHVRERDLEDDARFDPAHWGSLPLCPTCGRPLIAQELCGACGDPEDMAA